MHLGNIRVALLNYLFAQKNSGTFVVRIEDTDFERNIDPQAKNIVADLNWLGLTYNEGPEVEGPYGPYFQSQRTELYREKLEELRHNNSIYRCFCSTEDLEKKRTRQIALKQPPRYDRSCLKLDETTIQENLAKGIPFVWRFKVAEDKEIMVKDLAHGTITFNLKDFSDFPITRADGSFTFTFANCVDDIAMEISHVIRGEDHIANTANQVALYHSFNVETPTFWHVAIIGNIEGKKLSKRDFGFSLNDLKKAGFLPEAICNYLGIIGGSFEKEILSLEELTQAFDFDNMHATGLIKYDLEKLRWINHKWIEQYDTASLTKLCLPFLIAFHPEAASLSLETVQKLVGAIKTDLITLHDAPQILGFYFKAPTVSTADIANKVPQEKINPIVELINKHSSIIEKPDEFMTNLKREAKEKNISLKELFGTLRLLLTGSTEGMGIKELIDLLGTQETKKRLTSLVV
jgi:glutamyl-tRNA synthetase